MKPLEKLVDSVANLHRRELVPAKRRVSVMRQMLLFRDIKVRMYHHVSLGNYYESMTSALWGGKLTNRVHVLRNGSSGETEQNNSGECTQSDEMFEEEEVPFDTDCEEEALIKPDLVDRDGRAIGESKACRIGHSCNLFDAQLHRYKEMQAENRDSEVYFAFYRHDLMRVKSFEGTEEDLFREMTNRTYFAVRLPFSAILAMHGLGVQEEKPNFFRRYQGDSFPWCTILKSQTLNHILGDAKGTFQEFGLNPRAYIFERYKSPKDFEIEGNVVKQFPILCVHDRRHGAWVKKFVSENSDLVKRQEEHQKTKEAYDPRADGCSDV